MKKLLTFVLAVITATVFAQCPEVVNYAGKDYTTVEINGKCWLKENLNVGTTVPNSKLQANDGKIEKWCYGNLESNCDTYGGFYQFAEAVQYDESGGVKGICPSGWHIPTYLEWLDMIMSIGEKTLAGANMKEAGYTHWDRVMPWKPNDNAYYVDPTRGEEWIPDNESGFTALGGGYVNLNKFGWIKKNAYFWTSTVVESNYFHPEYPSDGIMPIQISLIYSMPYVSTTTMYRHTGANVRCVKD